MSKPVGIGKQIKCVVGYVLCGLVLALNYSPPVRSFFQLPDQLNLLQGQVQQLNIGLPVPLLASDADVLRVEGETLETTRVWQNGSTVELDPQSVGTSTLELSLFGKIPLKRISVTVVPQQTLVPGGQSIGVSLYTQGTLVVGRSDIVTANGEAVNPAKEADLRPGDVIVAINDIEIENSAQLAEVVAEYGQSPLHLQVLRGGNAVSLAISAVRDQQDGQLRLGIWIRDSTAGVGTLTFYNPSDGTFGALGHPITDVDTGTTLSVKDGEIVNSRIIDVKIGERGSPGELHGLFTGNGTGIGRIDRNTQFGIYGETYAPVENQLYTTPIPVGSQSAVHTGHATILTTVDDEGVKEYDCEIIKVTRQSSPAAKGMVVQITDPELLQKTGGIVQGMSGSPILQDGCIVGAITHVFISDPTKGHGIFIEWMLQSDKE